jgi:hypothetical protein
MWTEIGIVCVTVNPSSTTGLHDLKPRERGYNANTGNCCHIGREHSLGCQDVDPIIEQRMRLMTEVKWLDCMGQDSMIRYLIHHGSDRKTRQRGTLFSLAKSLARSVFLSTPFADSGRASLPFVGAI